MRTWLTVVVSLLVVSTAAADEGEWVGQPILEPLVAPESNVAVKRAQQTLIEAGKLVSGELDGKSLPRMGFGARAFKLGELSFHDASAVYRKNAAGETVHIGYTFHMRAVGDQGGPFVPIAVGRRGRIANRLFSGSNSVFAQAAEVSADKLQGVLRKDLASDHALDLVSKWNAHRQAKLGSIKPYTLGATKPVTAIAPNPAIARSKPKLMDRIRALIWK